MTSVWRPLWIVAALLFAVGFLLARSESQASTRASSIASQEVARPVRREAEAKGVLVSQVAPQWRGANDNAGPMSSIAVAIAAAQAERERLLRDRAEYLALKNTTERTELQESLLRAIEEASRYPSYNQRFAGADVDPVLRQREPELRTKQSDDGRTVLMVSCDKKQYDPGATVLLHAVSARIDAKEGSTSEPFDTGLRAYLLREGGPVLAELAMKADGRGRFSAQLDTAQPRAKPLDTGIYELRVSTSDGLTESARFLLRPAYARLTGDYRDHLDAGAIVIEAQVEVFEQGDYLLFASLYNEDGTPVGTVEGVSTLPSGTHWVPLRFHGLLIHDAKQDGPYRLGHIRVNRRMFPIWEGVEADPNFQTARYRLNELSAEPHFRLDATDGEEP